MKKLIILLLCFVSLMVDARSKTMKDDVQRFMETMYYIDMLYVDTINTEQLTNTAITKMLAELDPHSQFIEAKEVAAMNEHINGEFEGVGISYNIIEDTLVVIQAVGGGPSEKVGILPGDKIVKVDGQSICGKAAKRSDIQRVLRGKKGTKVVVEVKRGGVEEGLEFVITRDVIPIYSIDAYYKLNPTTAYIKLNSFSHTTIQEFDLAMAKMMSDGMIQHLVLDLQSNGGGLLGASTDLVDRFFGSEKLIVYTEGTNQRRMDKNTTVSARQSYLKDVGVTILIDEYSASASEIVSGAFQDWDRGMIVGRRSYGKGLVQRPIKLSDGSELRLTVARYHTPSGRCIQKPYTDGKDSYYKDLETRFKSGEFQSADSIDFPDSLRYKTLTEGREVYGGGGIFPDVFVPLDTTEYTPYYRSLMSKGLILKEVSRYLDSKRDALKDRFANFEDFDRSFEVSEELLKSLIAEGETSKVKYNKKEYQRSKELLEIQMKALIARRLYDETSFYKILNQRNAILLKAQELIEKDLKN